ncbi:MAG: LysR family transcriptional regulator [Tissierellia bacterium]|nr:LysR family transcriptional regulator [Tissierellia bacterium]
MKPYLKIALKGEKRFMGPGPLELLKNIEKTRSVKKAAKKMELSYSKAWKMINLIEKEIGFSVVYRKSGGSYGGESTITEDGKRLIELYEIFDRRVKEYAEKEFHEIFKDF